MGRNCTSKFPMMSEYPLPSFEGVPGLYAISDGIDHAELQINALIENNDFRVFVVEKAVE